jgi:hypothetical protein
LWLRLDFAQDYGQMLSKAPLCDERAHLCGVCRWARMIGGLQS